MIFVQDFATFLGSRIPEQNIHLLLLLGCSVTLWRLGVWNFARHFGMIGLSAFVRCQHFYDMGACLIWKPVGSRSQNPTGGIEARWGRHAQENGYMGSKQSELTLWNNKWCGNILKSTMFPVFSQVYYAQLFVIWKGTSSSMAMYPIWWVFNMSSGCPPPVSNGRCNKNFPWMHSVQQEQSCIVCIQSRNRHQLRTDRMTKMFHKTPDDNSSAKRAKSELSKDLLQKPRDALPPPGWCLTMAMDRGPSQDFLLISTQLEANIKASVFFLRNTKTHPKT